MDLPRAIPVLPEWGVPVADNSDVIGSVLNAATGGHLGLDGLQILLLLTMLLNRSRRTVRRPSRRS